MLNVQDFGIPKTPCSIGAVIKNSIGKIILLRRTKKDRWSEWELPGGKCERRDKTILQSLLREAKEETNLNLIPIEFLGKIMYKVGKRDYPQYNYLCKLKEKNQKIKINKEEHDEYRWVSTRKGIDSLIVKDKELAKIIKKGLN